MRVTSKNSIALVAIIATSALAGAQLDKIIKGVGVGAAVQAMGPQINSAVNKIASHKDVDSAWTKTVPIISVGKSAAVGAAQVMGSRRNVEKVKAVAQLEGDVLGSVRIKALIPISSDKASGGNIDRVQGVGVSAVVDIRL